MNRKDVKRGNNGNGRVREFPTQNHQKKKTMPTVFGHINGDNELKGNIGWEDLWHQKAEKDNAQHIQSK